MKAVVTSPPPSASRRRRHAYGSGETTAGDIAALQRENAQLREAIDSRALIEQAKGALTLRYGLDDDAAFAVLRRWSQSSNIKVHTVADILINVVCREGSQPCGDREFADWLQEQIRAAPVSVEP